MGVLKTSRPGFPDIVFLTSAVAAASSGYKHALVFNLRLFENGV